MNTEERIKKLEQELAEARAAKEREDLGVAGKFVYTDLLSDHYTIQELFSRPLASTLDEYEKLCENTSTVYSKDSKYSPVVSLEDSYKEYLELYPKYSALMSKVAELIDRIHEVAKEVKTQGFEVSDLASARSIVAPCGWSASSLEC